MQACGLCKEFYSLKYFFLLLSGSGVGIGAQVVSQVWEIRDFSLDT